MINSTTYTSSFYSQTPVLSGVSSPADLNAGVDEGGITTVSGNLSEASQNESAGQSPGESGSKLPDKEAVTGSADSNLSEEEQKQVDELAARDREVRAHEAAHANVGGRYAGSPSFSFQRGPDGNSYAVSGEVPIDISPVSNDPQATIQKARIVRRAALAPAEPSAQDRAVAAEAVALEREATAQLLAIKSEASSNANEESEPSNSSNQLIGKAGLPDDIQRLIGVVEASYAQEPDSELTIDLVV